MADPRVDLTMKIGPGDFGYAELMERNLNAMQGLSELLEERSKSMWERTFAFSPGLPVWYF